MLMIGSVDDATGKSLFSMSTQLSISSGMRTLKQKPKAPSLSPQTVTLLSELGEECQRVLKLLAQLGSPGLREAQVEAILGELSAAVLHLHEHTRGLDEIIGGDRGGG